MKQRERRERERLGEDIENHRQGAGGDAGKAPLTPRADVMGDAARLSEGWWGFQHWDVSPHLASYYLFPSRRFPFSLQGAAAVIVKWVPVHIAVAGYEPI